MKVSREQKRLARDIFARARRVYEKRFPELTEEQKKEILRQSQDDIEYWKERARKRREFVKANVPFVEWIA